MDKNSIGEKLAFVLHKLVLGVLYTGGFMLVTKLQNLAMKLGNGFSSFIGYLIPALLLCWFFDISRRKNTWKPFGKFGDGIEAAIILLTAFIIYLNRYNLDILNL